MKVDRTVLKKILLEAGVTTAEKLKDADQTYEESGQPYEEILISKKIVSEKDIYRLYYERTGIPFAELEGKQIPRDILLRVPERIARKYQAVLFEEKDGKMHLAMSDPEDYQAAEFIQKESGYRVKVFAATPSDIAYALDQYREELGAEITRAIKESEFTKTDESVDTEISADEVNIQEVADAPIAKAVNIIFGYAVKQRATDIHIEPRENLIQIRYRVDGILHEVMTLPSQLLPPIISRIKIIANLKIDEHRLPQDGRIKVKVAGKTFGIRVSILPTIYGEKVVMRLLEESARAVTSDELGFQGTALEALKRGLSKPHGMTLVTGPTGSGKTTTLYTLISYLNNPGVNISTVEDPVEYHIPGVNQVQVNVKTGLDFATTLRALLRQDPNIIMVGEIRDKETLEISIHAALTGHIILSTLHTNNAAAAIPRMLDMGAESFLVSSTVNTVIGQRLVRKLCPFCKQTYDVSGTLLADLKKQFDIDDALAFIAGRESLPRYINKDDIKRMKEPATKKSSGSKLTLYKLGGCGKCDNSGYLGRLGIYEVLEVTPKIQDMITGRAASEAIQGQAIKEGMITMQQDGFIKALDGVTTIEEVSRVTKE